jgi:hypothetical protein
VTFNLSALSVRLDLPLLVLLLSDTFAGVCLAVVFPARSLP